jgi:hypothetical protein
MQTDQASRPFDSETTGAQSSRRRWRRFAYVATVVAALVATPVVATSASAASTRYVFTAFTNSSQSNMYVYTSTDGLNFSTLKANAYTPPSGLVRDPSVLKVGSKYFIVYTNNWTGSSFGVASSTNLTTWTYVTTVNVGVSGTQETWAPEFFVDTDGSVNVIVSLSPNALSSDSGFRPYRLKATNTALTSWSSATALSGGYAGANYIDTFIVRYAGYYHAFSKNESTKYIEHARSTALGGPYTFVGTGNWAGWGAVLEGPALTHLDSGTWRIYMDGYSQHKYFYADSSNLTTFGAKKEIPGGLSGVVRHGTVLHETV